MSELAEDYRAIPRIKRLAMFFAVVGEESAARVLKSFGAEQAEAVIRELAQLDLVDEAQQQQVIDEFSGLLVDSASSARGGFNMAIKVYEGACGAARAQALAAELGPVHGGGISILADGLRERSASQILGLFKGEQAQTLAYVLSVLDPEKAAEVLSGMDEHMRSEVVVRMSGIGPTPSDLLHKVLGNVPTAQASTDETPAMLNLGGANHLATVLKQMDTAVGKHLLSAIDAADPAAGVAVSKEMFSFRDLIDLAKDAMQILMREVDAATMVIAMKSATPELHEKIYGSLSKRGAEALREEYELQGLVRKKEVEVAQSLVLDIVRRLEEEGQITLGDGGDDYV